MICFSYFFLTPVIRILAMSEGSNNTKAVLTKLVDPDKSVPPTGSLKSLIKGFLIVETNFRVYAYTNSTLQLAILSTFTELNYRFQDVAMGSMTRDSVRRALQVVILKTFLVDLIKFFLNIKGYIFKEL